MSSKSERTSSQNDGKAKWVKPVLTKVLAGSAEVGPGTLEDGDPGTALNNS